MNNYYFTFGSDPRYPYGRDDYVLVQASNFDTAIKLYQALHPNRPGSSFVNCAGMYDEADWQDCKQYYVGVGPVETITVRRRG